MNAVTPDGEPAPQCHPVERPLPVDDDEEVVMWIGSKDKQYGTPLERLLHGNIHIDWGDDIEELSQSEFLDMWDHIERSIDTRKAVEGHKRKSNAQCALCNRMMVAVPGVDADCEVCGISKDEYLRKEWQLYVDESQRPPQQRRQLFKIPIHTVLFRDSISCPDGHFLCGLCFSHELPDKRPLSRSDLPADVEPKF